MTAQIIVVAAGNIGRRHLQALGTSDLPAQLFVVEPSPAAREETSALLGGEVTFATPAELPASADVAIVATTADVRRAVIEELLERVSVPMLILEKFLFQRPEDFDAVDAALDRAGARAWVNTPRRAWPFYRELRDRIGDPTPVEMDARVPMAIGIGSNAIHFVDLLAFLSGCSDIEVDGSGLDAEILDAKRAGAVEFTGRLEGRGSDGSELVYRTEDTDRILLDVSWRDGHIQVDETNDDVAVFQSRLTDQIVESLLRTGDCDLTPYAESARLHRAVLHPLLEHYRAMVDPTADQCPIT